MILNRLKMMVFLFMLLGSAALLAQAPRLQAVHGIPDPGLDKVDVYISLFGTAIQELQDVKFREANPMTEAPIPFPLTVDIGIAPGNSVDNSDVIASFPLPLQLGKTYIGMARGVQTPANFAPNPEGLSTALNFSLTDAARTVSLLPGKVQFLFAHLVTDAPTVDVVTASGEVIIDNAKYGDLAGYVTRDPGMETYEIRDQSGGVLGTFEVDLSTYADTAFTVMMSGFVDPAQNQNGAPLSLHGVFSSGLVIPFLPPVVNNPPLVANPIPDQDLNEDFASFAVANLTSVFMDTDSPGLNFSAVGDGNTGVVISGNDLILSSVANLAGFSRVIVSADDGEFSVSDTFDVTINAVNDPPLLVGIPDVTIDEEGQETLALASYLSDIDNSSAENSLSAEVLNAAGVQVGINPSTKEATITGEVDYYGQATVVFTASDPGGASDTDTILVTVNNVNDAPLVTGIPDVNFDEDTQTTLELALYIVDSDNTPDEINVTASVLNSGNIQINIDPDSHLATFSGSPDFSGNATAVFTATDQAGLSDSDTIQVTIMAVNDPPLLTGIPDVSFDEDGSSELILLPYVSDVDNSLNTILFSAQVLNSSDVQISIEPTIGFANFNSSPNFYGQVLAVFRVTDPGGATDTDTILVTVNPVNDAPLLAGLPDVGFSEDARASLKLNAYLNDIDNDSTEIGFSSEVISAAVPGGAQGIAVDISDLQISIDPATHVATFMTTMDTSGVFEVVFTATDPGGLSDTDTLTVTVSAVNDPPVIVGVPEVSFDEDDSAMLDLKPYLSDPDNPIADLVLGAEVSGEDLTVVIDAATMVASFDITPDSSGLFRVVFSVVDPGGLSDTDTVTVTVNPVNDAPLLAGLPDVGFGEDARASLKLNAYLNDIDNDSTEIGFSSEVISAAVPGGAQGIAVDISDLQISIDPATHVATFMTTMDTSGVFEVVFTATDPGGLSDTDTVTVTVSAVNDPPVIAGVPEVSFDEDGSAMLDMKPYLSDPDNPIADLVLGAEVSGEDLTVVIDAATMVASFDITPDSSGLFRVVFSVVDPGGLSDTDTVTVTVNPVNDAPLLAGLPDVGFGEDARASLKLNAYLNDIDNDSTEIGFSSEVISAAVPGGAQGIAVDISDLQISIDPATHVATFMTTMDTSGVFEVVFTATDPGGLSDTDTVTVTVSAVNDPPVIAGVPEVSFDEEDSAMLDLKPYLSDPDNPIVDLVLGAEVSGEDLTVVIDAATMVASFDITPDSSGLFRVVFSVVDPGGLSDTDTVTVTVNPVNDAPLLAGLPDVGFSEDARASLKLNAYLNDIDNDSTEIGFSSEVISAAVPGGAQGIAVDISDLQISIDPATHVATFMTTMDTSGVFEVVFTATDPGGLSDTDTLTVTVSAVNDPPQLVNPIADIEIQEDSGTLTAVPDLYMVFKDIDDNELSFLANAGSGISADVTGGILQITPDPDFNGRVQVIVVASDMAASVTDTFMVTVLAINDAPTIFSLLSPPDSFVVEQYFSPVDFSWGSARDVDGDLLSYTFRLKNDAQDTTITGMADTTMAFEGLAFWKSLASYNWWIIVSDGTVDVASSDTFTVQIPLIESIEDPLANDIPVEFALEQNYPNPFNPTTAISYTIGTRQLSAVSSVKLVIYNSLGQQVKKLVSATQSAGRYVVQWDATNDLGQRVASGLYLYRIQAGTYVQVRKMLLMQ